MRQLPPSARGREAEKAWQATLFDPKKGLFPSLRWATNHTYQLKTESGAWRTSTTALGWPDWTCLREEYILAVEVKGFDRNGRPTPFQPHQKEWLQRFARIPTGRAWVLRPTDSMDDIVEWARHPADAPRTYGWEPDAD
jgi:hypothetical protein